MMWHAGSFINTVNHMLGYKTNTIKDSSTNNFFTGYLVSGEGWHNNHHAAPADAQFGKKWWEFDLGWQVIKLVRK
jgi:stearoyl-CoA desaturase (delta-9 desaturase)